VVAYKPLLDEAIKLASHKPAKVLLVDRGLSAMEKVAGRDVDYAPLRAKHLDTVVPCAWVDATHPSYTLYTSGTTGKPKGVQRDTGGYAVALAASMKHIFCGNAGETYFSTSDIGWVVGHSYIIYGPLLAGMATIMYEGLPTRPDAGVWWSLVEKYKVTVMFSAPTAVRVLKKQDPAFLTKYDLSSLRALFLAGEPLDEPTAKWIADSLGKPIIDNYWQTETGWPILTIANGAGVLGRICTIIGEQKANISDLTFVDRKPDFYRLIIEVELRDAEHLHMLLTALEAESDVAHVERIRDLSRKP